MTATTAKTTKRGKRGGQKRKARLLAGNNVGRVKTETAVPEPQDAMEMDEDVTHSTGLVAPGERISSKGAAGEGVGEEIKKKKTRRGKRGKAVDTSTINENTAAIPAMSGANSIQVGSGRSIVEDLEAYHTQYATPGTNASYGGSRNNYAQQPFFGLLPPSDRDYILNLEPTLDEAAATMSPEDRQLLIQNIFQEIDGKEAMLAADPDGSRVFEKILRLADDFTCRVLADRLSGQYHELFRHQFASHVCQTLLYLAADIVDREVKGVSVVKSEQQDENEKLNALPTMSDTIVAICDQLDGQWADLMVDTYATHLVRVLLTLLSGESLEQAESQMRSKKSKKYNSEKNNQWAAVSTQPKVVAKRTVPEAFTTTLERITTDLVTSLSEHSDSSTPSNTKLRAYALHPMANPVLQLLLSFPSCHVLLPPLLGTDPSSASDDADTTPDPFITSLLTHPIGSRLLEKLLPAVSAQTFHQLYLTYFRNRLLDLCSHTVSNHIVQHLIANTRTETQWNVILEELLPGVETFFFTHRAGVVVKMVQMAATFGTGQKEIVKSLLASMQLHTPSDHRRMVECLISLTPLSRLPSPTSSHEGEEVASHVSILGSLLLQHLLHFTVPVATKLVLDSLLSLPLPLVSYYARHPAAAHVLDAFLLSSHIDIKFKRKLIRQWVPILSDLAVDKYGSRIVEKCYAVADIAVKTLIAEQLVQHEKKVNDSFCGRFVWRNCKCEVFKRGRGEWEEREMGVERKKEMFKEFLGDSDTTGVNKAQKIKKDTLWTTRAYDEGLGVLGFGGNAQSNNKQTTTDKKKKKVSAAVRDFENTQKLALNEDGTNDPHDDVDKETKHEIENLFKKAKKEGHSGKRDREDDDDDDDDGDDANDVIAEPKKKQKVSKDLENVLSALEATKRKKKKKTSQQDGVESGKKRRKFES
ncbi:Nucleolar protein 9 [Gaertneriomyces sp. JEL0708]|nr:Nucleolar protein 9 [Gaertneriomyces sp. JEL0708]